MSFEMDRRSLLTAIGMTAVAATVSRAQTPQPGSQATADQAPATTLRDVPLTAANTVTAERRGDIVLIGLNRPQIQNRIDPPTRLRLGEIVYEFEHDPALRCAVLFGHGENFSRGIDVDAAQAGLISGQRATSAAPTLDVLGNSQPHRTKPVVIAVHGDTWNLGHEMYLACDIRIASADTRFGQDENTHGRFPGGGATVRFVREAGWGNAMRYMLTGDHWSAEESRRMGVTQEIAPNRQAAIDLAVAIARRVAACGPLGIKATLASAHQVVDPVEADALSKLGAQYAALYRTEDFLEGRRAEAEGRPPKYSGK
jgi:enoyl-CoA hydratase/carnithine racemase